jgi:hypothetical protein
MISFYFFFFQYQYGRPLSMGADSNGLRTGLPDGGP